MAGFDDAIPLRSRKSNADLRWLRSWSPIGTLRFVLATLVQEHYMIASSAIRSDFLTELRQFRYFVEIARRGSFTAASRTLHITQSALSEQIMRLERELDCRLFDRGRHGAKVTVAGERLLGRAEELLRVSNEIDRSIGHFGRPRTETLRIGMTMSPAISWFWRSAGRRGLGSRRRSSSPARFAAR